MLELTAGSAELSAALEEAEQERRRRTSETSRRDYRVTVFYDVIGNDDDEGGPDVAPEPVTLRLRYAVDRCGWSPQYLVSA